MNDKRLVEQSQDSFDVLALQANLAISAPQALASWSALDKPFWIDPIVYAFAAAPTYLMSEQKVERGRPETTLRYKRTFESLAQMYGEPFSAAVEEQRSLTPADCAGADLHALTQRVLDWQRTILQPPQEDTKYGLEERLEPVLLTVPFFPLQAPGSNNEPPWLQINLELAAAARELVDPDRLALGLLVETDLFGDWRRFEQILETYLGLGIKDIWFWISDNDEIEMPLPRAKRIVDTVRRAERRHARVHMGFGGAFSSLLLSRGLQSVAHGVNYWENKHWEPLAGGGLPTARYLYPPLGQRLPVPEAAAAFEPLVSDASDFHELVCRCPTCRQVINGDIANFALFGEVQVRHRRTRFGTSQYDAPTAAALELTKRHYLQAKGIEVETAIAIGFDPDQTLREAIENHQTQFVSTRHLETWRRALTEPPSEA